MVLNRTVLFYALPPIVLGTLFTVYRVWFAGDDAPPPTPDSTLTQPADGGSPFGSPGSAGDTPVRPVGGGATVPANPNPPADPGPATTEGLLLGIAKDLLAAFPEAAQWAQDPGLLTRLVAAADCIAQGGSPSHQLPFLRPATPFRVQQTAAGWVIDPASFHRYDRAVDMFCAGDPARVAAVYKRLEPALDLAYGKLGYGEGRFRDVLASAAGELLAVPVPAEPVAVVPSGRTYSYADPNLQAMGDARKHLLRTGPANVRRVQERIRALSRALGLAVAAVP